MTHKTLALFPDYEFYEDGQIVSNIFKAPRILRPISMGQYFGLSLRDKDGIIRRGYVHRLIAEAFHGPCPDGHQCRHLDGNRYNNAAWNLAWGLPSENAADKVKHGTSNHGENNAQAKLTMDDVNAMRAMRAIGGVSFRKIAEQFDVSTMTAFRAVTNQTWSSPE